MCLLFCRYRTPLTTCFTYGAEAEHRRAHAELFVSQTAPHCTITIRTAANLTRFRSLSCISIMCTRDANHTRHKVPLKEGLRPMFMQPKPITKDNQRARLGGLEPLARESKTITRLIKEGIPATRYKPRTNGLVTPVCLCA